VQDGTLSCYNESTIRENSADWGGGVYLNSGAIEGCELESNEANYGGGIGIHAAEEFRLESLTVKENTAVHYGGGVYTNDVRGEMNSCLIEGNTAEYGGGMIVFGEESTIVLNEGKYLSNQASENGGGIYFDMGYLEGNSIDFGLVEQVNSPDDIGVYESNYSGLGEDRSFICQDTSGVFSCSY